MKRLISILAIVAVVFAFGAIPANADQGAFKEFRQPEITKAKWVADEILVKFKGDAEHFRVVKIPEGKVLEKVQEYSSRPDVDYAEPNYYVYASWTPNDPYYSYQWNLDNPVNGGIEMEQAWGVETGSGSVVVAVVDTGVAYENYSTRLKRYYLAPDLANTEFVAGYDFVENDTHPNDDNSHGTHVTGTIAQSTNNGIGVAGIAFNTAIMPVKVLNKSGSGTDAGVASGIIWAVDHGADIINLSLGGPSPSSTLENAVKYAYEHGVAVVAAAGNDGSAQISYPAAYDDYVIAVGATRYDKTLASYSNHGSSLDVVAPGGDTSVDQNGDGYVDGVLQNTFNPNTKNTADFGYWFFQGTSMAAPHVSGVAALLLAHGNADTPDEVRAALQDTADDLGVPGRDNTYGWGLVNAYAALQWTAGPGDNPPTVSITSPADGATVSGVVTVAADASDDVGVARVDFYCGSALIGTDMTAPYSIGWDSTAVTDGEYTLTATAIDTASQEASDSITVTVNNVNEPPGTIHVADLDGSKSLKGKSGRWEVRVTVTIHDESGNPVAGATVTAGWTGAITGTVSGITASNGVVTLSTGSMTGGSSVTFTVAGVTHATLTYDATANHDPDGESNGTDITVTK